jgi:hypothetical protein
MRARICAQIKGQVRESDYERLRRAPNTIDETLVAICSSHWETYQYIYVYLYKSFDTIREADQMGHIKKDSYRERDSKVS